MRLGCTCSKLWLNLSTEAGRGRLSQGPGTRHSRLREVLPPTCSRLSETAWREGRAEDAGIWSLAAWVLSTHAHGSPDRPVPCPLPQSPHPRGIGSPSAPGQPRCAISAGPGPGLAVRLLGQAAPPPTAPFQREPRIGFYLGYSPSWRAAGREASRGGAGPLPLPAPSGPAAKPESASQEQQSPARSLASSHRTAPHQHHAGGPRAGLGAGRSPRGATGPGLGGAAGGG